MRAAAETLVTAGRRQRLSADTRREQIVRAQTEVIAASGYATATLAAIAEAAGIPGIAEGPLWHYFDDCDDLARQALAHLAGQLRAARIADLDLNASAPEVIRAVFARTAPSTRTHGTELETIDQIVHNLRTPDGRQRLSMHDDDAIYVEHEALLMRGRSEGSIRRPTGPHHSTTREVRGDAVRRSVPQRPTAALHPRLPHPRPSAGRPGRSDRNRGQKSTTRSSTNLDTAERPLGSLMTAGRHLVSGSLAHVPGRNAGAPPPTVLPRVLSALLGLLLLAGTVTLTAGPAYADSEGVRRDLGEGFLGGYDTDVDGRQACSLDSGSNPALRQTSGPSTITSLDSLSRHQLAELNFVQDRWRQSGDANITAAVALFTLSVADPGTCNSHGMSDDECAVGRGSTSERAITRANVATMRQEAAVNAVTDPSLSLSLASSDRYSGTPTVDADAASLTGTVALTEAVFSDGSTGRILGVGMQHPITGTPADGVTSSSRIAASTSVPAAGYGAALDLSTTPGSQRLVAAIVGSSSGLSAAGSYASPGTITAPESGFYTHAGINRSGTTTVDTAGNVCWLETPYDADGDGEIIAQGECGTPGETTAIHEQPEELTAKTSAASTVVLGESAHDLATVTGTVPDGDRLVFEAYRHASDTVTCSPDELVLTSAVIDLDGPGEYRPDDVTFTQVGVYYGGKTILNAEGLVPHRGARGAPDETTTVTSVPETRETPGKPNTPGALAHTGGGDWWPLGLIGGLMAAATGGVLLFGRRLAITRERNGYVREEDRAFQAFQDDSDGAEEK